ncbi:5-methylcytosine-specific restriction endonuclease system specificity protein McrC [Arthrobacter sp. PAMC 25486]|uniref:5-methylcytosine restriction system specificity protein McrC n=1 Tax=Arthrobacter sp. PAMC 25486 TaxID=1494608 RepID=UPI00138E3F4E|nr:5-methylcytosine-specific restriction endonuclease system specificity protein McrC [Arthrobacter sp. PAMC 25486]
MTPEEKVSTPTVVISGKTEIPIANLWMLMLYASKFYEPGTESIDGAEKYPELLPDLLAEILVASVGERIRKPLTPIFSMASRDLRRVRGRIDALRTESHQLLRQGQIACRFDELTNDSPRNRMVLAALNALAPLVGSKSLASECRNQSRALERMGVSSHYSAREARALHIRLTRNDTHDWRMIHAAQLALAMDLPMDSAAPQGITRKSLDIHEFRRLFEAAVGGLYAATLVCGGWRVLRGRQLEWNAEFGTNGASALMPQMKTDIILENATDNRRIVIDTKFTSILAHGKYGKDTFKSSHLYQLYTYVRTQEKESDPLSVSSEGMLIYPATGQTIRETIQLSGHKMTVATIDLTLPAAQIRRQLLDVILA